MKGKQRWNILILSLLLLLFYSSASPAAPNFVTIDDIKVDLIKDVPEINVTANMPAEYLDYMLEEPPRIVIDPVGVVYTSLDERLYSGKGLVKSVVLVKAPGAVPDELPRIYYPLDFIVIELERTVSYDILREERLIVRLVSEAKPVTAKRPAEYVQPAQQPVTREPAYAQPTRQLVTREFDEYEQSARQPVARQPVARQPVARQPVARQPEYTQPARQPEYAQPEPRYAKPSAEQVELPAIDIAAPEAMAAEAEYAEEELPPVGEEFIDEQKFPLVEKYRLEPGDKLEISVWQHPDLLREVVVRPDGYISFPLAGEINASGLTAGQLSRELSLRLGRKLRKPEVSVIVSGFGSKGVFVLGAVRKPGLYPYTRRMTVLSAVSSADSWLPQAYLKSVLLVKRGFSEDSEVFRVNLWDVIKKGKFKKDATVEPGDIVYVPQTFIGNLGDFMDALRFRFGTGYYISHDL